MQTSQARFMVLCNVVTAHLHRTYDTKSVISTVQITLLCKHTTYRRIYTEYEWSRLLISRFLCRTRICSIESRIFG